MEDTFMKEKPVLPLLVSMALPMVISMLVNALYNIVDSLFVAKISEDAMTALSLVYPAQNLINAMAIGFGVGLNAVISICLGGGDTQTANRAATHGAVLSVLHGVVLTLGSIAVTPAFLRLFTQQEQVLELGVTYARIAFSFSLVIMLNLLFEKLFQAVGRMRVTMVGLMCGCVANIVLAPLLIFGLGPIPAMGIAGAALATGLGQLVTLGVYLGIYIARPLPVRISRRELRWDGKLDRKLYAVGIPAVLNLALPSLLVSCLNALLSTFGQSYVVILGIYYKLQTFLYLPANGIVQGMRPLIGYNYGAGEMDRVRKIYTATLGLCLAIMALGTGLCLVASGQLMALFTDNPETVAAGAYALRVISGGFLISAVSVTASGALEGLGKGAQSLLISLCRYAVLLLPAAAVLSQFLGPSGVWNAFWVTEAISAVLAGVIYRKSVARR